MTVLPRCYSALNIFITPELYRDGNMSFVRNLKKLVLLESKIIFFKRLEKKKNDPDLNINALYEFECDMLTTLSFQKQDFVLPNFKFKVEFADQTAFGDVKKIFDSTDTILIRPNKISAPSDLKEKLFGQGEKVRKLSKEIQLKLLRLAYESFLLYES